MTEYRAALGDVVKDKVTYRHGTVVGIADYQHGERQCLVVPTEAKDLKDAEGVWFYERRLEPSSQA